MPEGVAGARREQDLHERRVGGAPLDLGNRVLGVLLGHHDRRTQPRLWLHPAFELPVVDGARQRRREVEVALLHAAAAQRDQHADFDAVGIEMLAAHQVEVGARRAVLGEGVDTHAGRHHARIGQLAGQAVADVGTEGRHVLAPARRHERMQFGHRAIDRVNVAVDDLQPRVGLHLPDNDVHGASFAVCSDRARQRRRRPAAGRSRADCRSAFCVLCPRAALRARRRRPRTASADSRSRTAAAGPSPRAPSVRASMPGSPSGASTGCSVNRTCSRTMSAGDRSIHGTSGRTPRQVLPVRHSHDGQPGEARIRSAPP